MNLGEQRDAEELLAGFVGWLARHRQSEAPVVVGYERPAVGFSTETLLVDLRGPDGDERLVLKLPPSGPAIFPTYDFHLQARVQGAVSVAGIPAPVPVQVEDDISWIGVPFLVMPRLDGHIVAEVPVFDPWLTEADPDRNARLHDRYVAIVAAIHQIDWRAAGLADVVPVRDDASEIAYWRDYLAWYGDGIELVPTLVEALDWCERHLPAGEQDQSLLWGDVRLGNVIFDDEGCPVAVLDWEMATIGSVGHDVGWMLGHDAIQRELIGRATPGFLDRDGVVARYEATLGRSVPDLQWYEILAMVRSAAIMTRIGHLRELAGEPVMLPVADNPVLDVLKRRLAEGA